ncbi:hypothetical protein ACS0TY_032672 [Phlomoides rotata]
MTILERKNAIKLSSDVAIASTRTVATHWSQALVADVSAGGGAAKIVVEQILGRKVIGKKAASTITCSKKIVRRSHWRRVVRSRDVKASSIAKKLVRNRTRVLKRLVPGGEDMDDVLLIKETLDYIASLQLQVDVMRHLAAGETLDPQQRFEDAPASAVMTSYPNFVANLDTSPSFVITRIRFLDMIMR